MKEAFKMQGLAQAPKAIEDQKSELNQNAEKLEHMYWESSKRAAVADGSRKDHQQQEATGHISGS